ncbi:hypothetical protein GCM10010116_34810 [Microbispora rosea subsp. aerata]|nr:hypothetical protein [Microbispora rosea]GGO17216.1 hypothetical protein GCM10010116_34810 [Microbispora rosea subsp. aerata]GIH56495.1 hypothetical protein Mro02_34090 [Microbispora rosea subsp. aerata]GLJ81976.1 hypothetical protein GCM10017588_07010 [Microbispora rosea subsp. aerata]
MRRRLVVRFCCLALILLTAAGAAAWVRYRSPLYQTSVSVAFMTKTNRFHGEVYDHFTDNHIYMALAIARYFDNPGTIKRLREMGGTAQFSYQVAHWGNEELPVYEQPYATIQAVSDNPDESLDTLNAALGMLQEKVESLQKAAGANGGVMIGIEQIGTVIGPTRQGLQLRRATVGIGLMAALASIAVITFTRDRTRDRGGRGGSRRGPASPAPAPAAPAPVPAARA